MKGKELAAKQTAQKVRADGLLFAMVAGLTGLLNCGFAAAPCGKPLAYRHTLKPDYEATPPRRARHSLGIFNGDFAGKAEPFRTVRRQSRTFLSDVHRFADTEPPILWRVLLAFVLNRRL